MRRKTSSDSDWLRSNLQAKPTALFDQLVFLDGLGQFGLSLRMTYCTPYSHGDADQRSAIWAAVQSPTIA